MGLPVAGLILGLLVTGLILGLPVEGLILELLVTGLICIDKKVPLPLELVTKEKSKSLWTNLFFPFFLVTIVFTCCYIYSEPSKQETPISLLQLSALYR